jgi:hypothetical protein
MLASIIRGMMHGTTHRNSIRMMMSIHNEFENCIQFVSISSNQLTVIDGKEKLDKDDDCKTQLVVTI